MNTGKWNKKAFLSHHNAHPEIYELFTKWALQAARKRPRYSARSIFHRMRWESDIEEVDTGFKLDAGWISHYARLFMKDHPEHSTLFEKRTRKNGYFTEEDDEDEV